MGAPLERDELLLRCAEAAEPGPGAGVGRLKVVAPVQHHDRNVEPFHRRWIGPVAIRAQEVPGCPCHRGIDPLRLLGGVVRDPGRKRIVEVQGGLAVPAAVEHAGPPAHLAQLADRRGAVGGRIGAHRCEGSKRCRIPSFPSPLEQSPEELPLVGAGAHLPDRHPGSEPVGVLLDEQWTDGRAVGPSEEDDLPGTEPVADVSYDHLRIVRELLERHRRPETSAVRGREALPDAALVPVDDGEEVLPRLLVGPGHPHQRATRAAVENEEH